MIRAASALLLLSAAQAGAEEPIQFPTEIHRACKGGRAEIYDECGSQFAVLAEAMAEAEATGKQVLVVYGAEWCIWCHVFHRHLAGQTGIFHYALEGDGLLMAEGKAEQELAERLRDYARDRFVLAYVEGQYSPDGWEVLEHLDAEPHYQAWIPFIFVLKNGAFAAALPDPRDVPGLEVRRDGLFVYRGYDRSLLLGELKKLAAAAAK